MEKFYFVPFEVNPWDVSNIVKKWISSWYNVPRDFVECAIVPSRFSRVFVPVRVVAAHLNVLIQGMDRNTPPEREPGEEEEWYHILAQIPWSERRCDSESGSKVFSVCSAASSTDRNFYSEWSHNVNQLSRCVFNPDTDFGLLVPLDLCNTVMLENLHSQVCAKKDGKKNPFQYLWASLKRTFEDPRVEERAPPSDAYVLSTVSDQYVWDNWSDGIKRELTRKCTEHWINNAGLNVTRTVESVSVTSFTHTSYIVHLPVYSGTYTYNGTQYRIAVNGYNGKVRGSLPQGSVGGFFHNFFRHIGF